MIWIFIVGTVIRIPFLFMTLNEAYGDRQTQTTFPARLWREDGFDPLLPTVPVFGSGGRELMLEFPVFQWLVYLFSFFSPNLDFAGRLAGLFFFELSAVGLYFLVSRLCSPVISVAVFALYQFNAFSLKWGVTATVDLAVIAFVMVGVALFSRGEKSGKLRPSWLIGAWIFLAASALIKPWGLAIWFPVIVFLALFSGRYRCGGGQPLALATLVARLSGAAAITVFSAIPAWLWNQWASTQRRGHQDGVAFIVGSLGERSPMNLAKILQFEFGFVIGGFFIAVTLAVGSLSAIRRKFWSTPPARLVAASILVILVPVIFFSGKFAAHNYYSILITPAVTVFSVILLSIILEIKDKQDERVQLLSGVTALFLLGLFNYLIVEGGQLLLTSPEERQATGGKIATLLSASAGLICFFVFLVYLKVIGTAQKNRKTTAALINQFTGRSLIGLTCLLLLLFFPIRWNVDTPRFADTISSLLKVKGQNQQSLILGCDATTVHYYSKARGLSLSSLALEEVPIGGETPTSRLTDFDTVVICESASDLNLFSNSDRESRYLQGLTYGGEYVVLWDDPGDFVEISKGVWVTE